MAIYDDNVVRILEGFSQLNPGIKFDITQPTPPLLEFNGLTPTSTAIESLRTVSPDEEILASASVPFSVVRDATDLVGPVIPGISDIPDFLSKLNLFEEPSVNYNGLNPTNAYFSISEGNTSATSKTLTYPSVDTQFLDVPEDEQFTLPPATDPSVVGDEDVDVILTVNDINSIKTALSSFQSIGTIAEPPLPFNVNEAFDTESTQTRGDSTLETIKFNLSKFQEKLDESQAAIDAFDPSSEEDKIQLAFVCTTPRNITLTFAKNDEIIPDSFTMNLTLLGQGDFINDFTFFMRSDILSLLIGGLDYRLVLSDNSDETDPALRVPRARFSTALPFERVIFDQAAYDQQVSDYNDEVQQYQEDLETHEAGVEENNQKLEDAKFGIRDSRTSQAVADIVQSITNGALTDPAPSYTAPTAQEVEDYAVTNLGYDPNYETNNPPPTQPSPLDEAEVTEVYFISSIVYWLPVVYQLNP